MVYNLAAKLLKTLTHMCNPTNTQQLPALWQLHIFRLWLCLVFWIEIQTMSSKCKLLAQNTSQAGFSNARLTFQTFGLWGFFLQIPLKHCQCRKHIFVLFLYRYFLLLCAQLKICQYDPSITPRGNTSHVSHKPSDCSQYLPFMPFSIFIRAYLVGLYFTLILL